MRIVLTLVLISSFFTAMSLSHASPDTPTSSADQQMTLTNKYRKILQGDSYQLISYNGKKYSGKEVTLSWDNHHRLSARFCNTISARAPQVATGYSRNIRSLGISTMMYCDDELLMQMENSFGAGIHNGMKVSLNRVVSGQKGQLLTFRTKSGDTFVFEYGATFME